MFKFPKKNTPRKKSKKTHLIHFSLSVVIVFIIQLNFLAVGSNFFGIVSDKVSRVATVISSTLALQTNEYRVTNLEKELIVSDVLTQAAQMKANDMAAKGYFSHRGPLGEEPWSWFNKVGYKYDYAGENLAVDFTESADVTTGWINSATHKANLLNEHFTEIGIATADGMFNGHKTTFVVQFFGTPISIKPVITPTVVVSEDKPIAVKPIVKEVEAVTVVATTTSLDTVDPTVPVATSLNTPTGQVLGTELPGYDQGEIDNNKYLQIFGILAVAFILIFIALKVVAVYKKKPLNS
jgi:uncharacterized protein YkwD